MKKGGSVFPKGVKISNIGSNPFCDFNYDDTMAGIDKTISSNHSKVKKQKSKVKY